MHRAKPRQHIATVPVAQAPCTEALWTSGGYRRGQVKAMPVAQTRPAPGLARPRPERFPSASRNQRAVSFFVKETRFYLRGSRSTRSFLTAFHLEPLQFYLFGLLEKILRRLRGFAGGSLDHTDDDGLLRLWQRRNLLSDLERFGRRAAFALLRFESEQLVDGNAEGLGELD